MSNYCIVINIFLMCLGNVVKLLKFHHSSSQSLFYLQSCLVNNGLLMQNILFPVGPLGLIAGLCEWPEQLEVRLHFLKKQIFKNFLSQDCCVFFRYSLRSASL